MRLIDADRLMDSLRCNVLIDVTPELEDTIAQQPAAFDKEKVIEELQTMKNHSESCKKQCEFASTEYFNYLGAEAAYETSIKIVEKGGIE